MRRFSNLPSQQYGKNGQPFVMPDPSLQPQVMLPQEHISWLIRQSDGVMSQGQVRKERNALAYLSMGVDYKVTMALIDKIINPCLQRKLNRVQGNVFDEIRASVDDTFGLDENSWHELKLHESLQAIINRTGTRAFFGLPVCRNQDYLYYLKRFILAMGAGTLIVGQLPLWLVRPLAASVINIPLRYYKAKALKTLLPIFTERIQSFERHEAGHTSEDEPEDFATQTIQLVTNAKDGTYNRSSRYLAEQHLLLVSVLGLGSRYRDLLIVESSRSPHSPPRPPPERTSSSTSSLPPPTLTPTKPSAPKPPQHSQPSKHGVTQPPSKN